MRIRRRGADVEVALDQNEASVLLMLCSEATLAMTDETRSPARSRLLPDAYRDDAEATEEFRRFTAESITARKSADLVAVSDGVTRAQRAARSYARIVVLLDAEAVMSWLRALTSMRLVLASEIGVFDDPVSASAEAVEPASIVYEWAGILQENLLRVQAR